MRTLVTGGAGFIGSHIADLLVEEGHQVTVIDNLVSGRRDNVAAQVGLYDADIRDPEITRIFLTERPHVVFHEAAQMSVKASTDDPIYDVQVNVLGLLNVLKACVTAGVRKIVFASSGATYGNPVYLPIDEAHPQQPASPYGITKMVAEHYLKYFAIDHRLRYTSLRYGNVYGPRQNTHGEAGVVAWFSRQLLRGEIPTIHWDGEQLRDYIFVRDVARANVLAINAGDDECIGIGTGVGTSVNQIYETICEILGVQVTPQRAPRRPGDLRTAYFANNRARVRLGWKPRVSLEEGLATTLEFYRAEAGLAVAQDEARV